uniref:Uncharacterized protein n=1 Tax=Caenorhabditis japonica TaxID=281687 RepID=A0A8R1HWZ9_CAEJA
MAEATKKISEEELEKQYEDYRAQFEHWKESNKSSIGTDAYNSYVKQFEQWEREVEARKAQQKNQRNVGMLGIDEKEAEAAAAYAQSQEAYVSHHLKAMEQAELQQKAAVAASNQQQNLINSLPRHQTVENTNAFIRDVMNPKNVIANGNIAQQQTVNSPPTLWGTPKPVFDSRDPLYGKWGLRAATSHTKPEPERISNPVACWMLLDTLREKKMVLAPHSNTVPPPPVANTS